MSFYWKPAGKYNYKKIGYQGPHKNVWWMLQWNVPTQHTQRNEKTNPRQMEFLSTSLFLEFVPFVKIKEVHHTKPILRLPHVFFGNMWLGWPFSHNPTRTLKAHGFAFVKERLLQLALEWYGNSPEEKCFCQGKTVFSINQIIQRTCLCVAETAQKKPFFIWENCQGLFFCCWFHTCWHLIL